MQPIRRLIDIVLDPRAKQTVKAGSHVFATLRNLAAIGAAAASIATGGFFVARDRAAESTPPPATAAPLTLLQQLRGPLAFEASFLQDLGTLPPLPTGAAPTAPLTARADGVDFAGPGGYTPLIVRHAIPARYVADLELVAQQGTDATFSYSLRNFGTQQIQAGVDAGNELVRLQYIDRSVTPARVTSLIPNAIPATGLQRGQTLKLAIAVSGPHYWLFVGGQLAAEVTDPRVTVADAPTTSLNMGTSVNRGVLSINSLKVYALAEAVEAPLLTQLKGRPVYEAAFPKDLATAPPLPSGARPTAQVSARPDVVDLLPSGAYAPIIVNRQVPARHVVELDLQSQPTTDGQFSWTLRSGASRGVQVALDPANELLRFFFYDSGATPSLNVPLIPSAVSVTGLQKGRVLHLAAAVDGARYRLFLDGELIGDVTETRVPVANAAQTGLGLGGNLTRGAFSLSKLKVYELREVTASPSTRP
jgi:hypothetical protein